MRSGKKKLHVPKSEYIGPINAVHHQGDQHVKAHHRLKGHLLTLALKKIRRQEQCHAKNGHDSILFTDENIFKIEEQYNHQNKIYAQTSLEVRSEGARRPSSFYVMVWLVVSHQGIIFLHFCDKGVKLVAEFNKRTYYKEL